MTCYLSEPGVEFEISTFFVNIFKNRSKFKKWKKKPPRQFYLIFENQWEPFSNKTKFLLCCPRKARGYRGYWWISRKPHNFTKIWGHHWIHLVFLIPEMYTFVHFCTSLLSNEMHKKPHFLSFRLGLTPTLMLNQCKIYPLFPKRRPMAKIRSFFHVFINGDV